MQAVAQPLLSTAFFQSHSHSSKKWTRLIGVSIFQHVPMNSSSWPICPLFEMQNLCHCDTKEKESIATATKDSRPLKGARALRVTARRHRKELLSLTPSGIASRSERVQERGERTCRARRQTIRYQMAGSRSHRVQCHSNWRWSEEGCIVEKWDLAVVLSKNWSHWDFV